MFRVFYSRLEYDTSRLHCTLRFLASWVRNLQKKNWMYAHIEREPMNINNLHSNVSIREHNYNVLTIFQIRHDATLHSHQCGYPFPEEPQQVESIRMALCLLATDRNTEVSSSSKIAWFVHPVIFQISVSRLCIKVILSRPQRTTRENESTVYFSLLSKDLRLQHLWTSIGENISVLNLYKYSPLFLKLFLSFYIYDKMNWFEYTLQDLRSSVIRKAHSKLRLCHCLDEPNNQFEWGQESNAKVRRLTRSIQHNNEDTFSLKIDRDDIWCSFRLRCERCTWSDGDLSITALIGIEKELLIRSTANVFRSYNTTRP